MKILLKTTLKIFIYLILLIIPVTLFITFFSLNQQSIPLWNIGIRNILQYSRNYFLPSIFISYLISTLLVVSLIDKMKVKSLIMLHIPAVLSGLILGGAFYLVQIERAPLPSLKGEAHLGLFTFLKTNVFNELDERLLFIDNSGENAGKGRHTLYLYNKNNNNLSIVQNVYTSQKGKNYIFVDTSMNRISIILKDGLPSGRVHFPYSDFPGEKGITGSRLITAYEKQIVSVYSLLRARMETLQKIDILLMAGSLLLSVLLIAIPLTYGLNDRGWGFSGIVGVFLILGILPYLYGFILKILGRIAPDLSILGKYSYLFPAILLGLCGILMDIIVKMMGRTKRV